MWLYAARFAVCQPYRKSYDYNAKYGHAYSSRDDIYTNSHENYFSNPDTNVYRSPNTNGSIHSYTHLHTNT